MTLFYFNEKPTISLGHGGKTMKKHMFQWKNLFIRIFLQVEVIKAFMRTKEKGESIDKMLNVWLRNCRSILAFMKKEIKDAKR